MSRLERDVANLRGELTLISSDASAARALAAGADRDVSEVRAELRAHTSALNALRQTQLAHGQALERLRESFQQQTSETSEGFAMLRSGMAQIVSLLKPSPGA